MLTSGVPWFGEDAVERELIVAAVEDPESDRPAQ